MMTMSCVIRRQGIRRCGGRYPDRAGVAELVRRARLKIGWPSGRAGSSPAPGIAWLGGSAPAGPGGVASGATNGATPIRGADRRHSWFGNHSDAYAARPTGTLGAEAWTTARAPEGAHEA